MSRYLLFANQMYCYPILRPLQQAILDRGDEAAWFIHNIPNLLTDNDAPLLESVEAVQAFNPDAVYVPTNWIPDFFPGVKVEVFHGFDVGKRAGTSQDHYRIRGLFDLYCTQGPHTTEPFNIRAQQHGYFKVAETGWSILDPLFKPEPHPTLRQRLGTDKPIILYGSTFSPALTSARTLAPVIKALSEKGDWYWLINLHPKMPEDIIETYKDMENENLTFYDSKQDIMPLLKTADVMLCDTSSIFLQYLVQNKPVVTFNTALPGPHLIDVHKVEDIEPALKYALTYPEEKMSLIKEYGDSIHPYRDGKSSERILQATDEFIAHHKGNLNPKPLNFWRKLQMRKRLGYYKFWGVKL